MGESDSGNSVNLKATPEGHMEVAIHSPTLPFASVHVESLTPVFQTDGVYGFTPNDVLATTGLSVGAGAGSGSTTAVTNFLKCSTGTTQYSFATIQSRRRLRYRPGQGVVGRFAGLFSTPAASSILVAGFGTGESGFYFGYNGTSFGILHSTGGVREIQTMTITTASTATNNYNVTLPSGAVVNVTATNNGSTVKTAYEIAQGTYPGWSATQRGSTVIFLANDVGNKALITLGQSGAGVPAVGTSVETLAGVAATDTWVAQASWNGDKMDGTGGSGFTLDPTKGNVYQIGIQYLGFGAVEFAIEIPGQDGNNATFVTCHTIQAPNSRTTPIVTQPAFPFTSAAYSAGSTTDVSVSISSFAGFIEGKETELGPRQTYSGTSTAVSTGSYFTLFTVRNERVYGGRANQAVVKIISFGAAHDDATPVSLFLIRNATLVGTPNFTQHSTSSCTYVDTASTTCTVTDNAQIITTIPIAQNSSVIFSFTDINTIQPGETITVAARAVTGTATWTLAVLNTREDI